MQPVLQDFSRRLAGVVVGTLIPVIGLAFVSIPFSLGHHPGESYGSAQTTAPASPSLSNRSLADHHPDGDAPT